MTLQQTVTTQFHQRFGSAPSLIVRAPGRVNLIGEHTDYNDGFVLPMTLDRATWIALRPREDGVVHIAALDYDQEGQFDLNHFENQNAGWIEYIKGVAWALKEAGFGLKGWEGVVAGDVPIGAGLSSSAALEMAVARAFSAASSFTFDPPLMAKLGQKTENKWVGVNSGIMDQMISAAGKADHALLIDCRSLETELVQIPAGSLIVVMDTGTRRQLVGSEYNDRRANCEEAARHFGVPALRDLTLEQFAAREAELSDLPRRRARHVIAENERVLRAVDAMKQGDAVTMGHLMVESHISMRDDFEISSPALNAMVEAAQSELACFGARMTGGGFAGCAVALVKAEEAETFASAVMSRYLESIARLGINPQQSPALYVCRATNGAEVVA